MPFRQKVKTVRPGEGKARGFAGANFADAVCGLPFFRWHQRLARHTLVRYILDLARHDIGLLPAAQRRVEGRPHPRKLLTVL